MINKETLFSFIPRSQRETHEDFPLPVGPRMALRPGLIIPLQDNKEITSSKEHR